MTNNAAASDWAGSRGEKWRDQVEEMEAMLAPVDEPLIHALKLEPSCRIADIGCGGGGTTFNLLRAAPSGSVVHGFDISPALIAVARGRLADHGDTVAFHVADVAAAPPPGEPYDRLVSRFGIMFFDDPSAAFANLARWLRPGGRFAFAVWSRLEENAWMNIARQTVAEVIELPPADPEAPGPFRYANPDRLLALLGEAGFGEFHAENWRGALKMGGGLPAPRAADFVLTAFGSFAELLAKAGGDAPDRARRNLTARYVHLEHDGTVHLDASVHILTGTRLR